jgi:hypothetical protein
LPLDVVDAPHFSGSGSVQPMQRPTPQPVLFASDAQRAPLSACIEGFSLHAANRVMASDRRGLWRLCAYGARGAVASSRLSEVPDGRFAYDMKRDLPDGGRAAREARAPDPADVRQPYALPRRRCASEPPAHTGRAPADDVDDNDRTDHPAVGADVPAFVVTGSVAEVDVSAVDASSRLGRAAEAGLRCRCPEVFALSGPDEGHLLAPLRNRTGRRS